MPREIVKLSPAQEPPPAWWPMEFHARQARIRPRVLKLLRELSRPASEQEVIWGIGGYSAREHRHLLALLIEEGLIRQIVRTERYSSKVDISVTRIYYELTEAK